MSRMTASRRTTLLAAFGLAASGLVVATSSSATAATPQDFVERYCPQPGSAPCLISATLNGVNVPAGGPDFHVEMTGKLASGGDKYFQWQIHQVGSTEMSPSDVWVLHFDLGTMDPDYTEAFAGKPDVDRGTNKLTYTANPILKTTGCNENAAWPWPCSDKATSQQMELNGEVWDKSTSEFVGFDRSQSAQGVNGIFLETAADGSQYLSSEMVNSHFLTDGTTVFKGQVRFRLPYQMLHDSFNVPDPSTMVASSLVGTVNGKPASFDFMQDPDGGGMIVDLTGLTFSKKTIVVRRGTIRPTRPTITLTKRVSAGKGKVTFTRSRPRGAKVHGYTARCVSGGQVVVVQGSYPTIGVTGLRRGHAYACRVRAKSKAGPSRWSAKKVLRK
jgi:hypothetical protein